MFITKINYLSHLIYFSYMKYSLFALGLLMLGFGLNSCRKYEEGPNISFRSKEARVTNNWKIESALVNGVERGNDPYWEKQKHYFYRNKSYNQTIIDPTTLEATNINGKWALYENGKKIAITQKNATGNIDSTNDYNIIKLFEKQFWIRKIDNSLELHFVPYE